MTATLCVRRPWLQAQLPPKPYPLNPSLGPQPRTGQSLPCMPGLCTIQRAAAGSPAEPAPKAVQWGRDTAPSAAPHPRLALQAVLLTQHPSATSVSSFSFHQQQQRAKPLNPALGLQATRPSSRSSA